MQLDELMNIDNIMENTNMELLAEVAYSKWASHRNTKYWYGTEKLWGDLSEDSQKWWIDFIKGIRNGFKHQHVPKLDEVK